MWRVIESVRRSNSDDHDNVVILNRFISSYWRPVFHFVRAQGYRNDCAEDLTQEFFLQKLIDGDVLSRADQARGRFRTFLLTVLKRFLSDQAPRRAPKALTFNSAFISVSTLVREDDLAFEPASDEDPEKTFMKQWADAAIAAVRADVRKWCQTLGRVEWFHAFEAYHFPLPGEARPSQQTLADTLGITRDQVRTALHRTNEKFAELFRVEIAEQVSSLDEVDGEIAEIQRLLE
jgi:RNA polymerase sigma-70 factor (ECF subfamily)